MKKYLYLLAILLLTATLHAQSFNNASSQTMISFVWAWPDNTVTIKCRAGSVSGVYGMYAEIVNLTRGTSCTSYFDCPLYHWEEGNIMIGDFNHGCYLKCGETYSIRVRQDNVSMWGNALLFTPPCVEAL